MRMSSGRIRSINRAITRVQASSWSATRKYPRQSTDVPTLAAAAISAGTVKVVAVPRIALPRAFGRVTGETQSVFTPASLEI